MDVTNIPLNQQYSYVAKQSRGYSQSFKKSDFFNMCRDDLLHIKQHNVDLLIDKFQAIQNDDPKLYFSYNTD